MYYGIPRNARDKTEDFKETAGCGWLLQHPPPPSPRPQILGICCQEGCGWNVLGDWCPPERWLLAEQGRVLWALKLPGQNDPGEPRSQGQRCSYHRGPAGCGTALRARSWRTRTERADPLAMEMYHLGCHCLGRSGVDCCHQEGGNELTFIPGELSPCCPQRADPLPHLYMQGPAHPPAVPQARCLWGEQMGFMPSFPFPPLPGLAGWQAKLLVPQSQFQ